MRASVLKTGTFLLLTTIGITCGAGAAIAETREPARTEPIDVENRFFPTGWMGDGEFGTKYVSFNGVSKSNPHSPPFCTEITYTFGPTRWAGIYWLNKADNWGGDPGEDYSRRKFTALTFWARGTSGEEVLEFKTGDVRNKNKPYRDSFAASLGRVILTPEWKQYTISLENKDLSSVIGGFCWVASADFNAGSSITFYLDDIHLE